jgi:hypothetical protein
LQLTIFTVTCDYHIAAPAIAARAKRAAVYKGRRFRSYAPLTITCGI